MRGPSLAVVVVLACVWFGAPAARADLTSDRMQYSAIEALLAKDKQSGVRKLEQFRASFNSGTDNKIRMEVLFDLVYAYFTDNDQVNTDKIRDEIIRLAAQLGDKESVARLGIYEVYALTREGKFERAIEKLDQMLAVLKDTKNPALLRDLELSYADVLTQMSKYELAVPHYLRALRLAEQLPKPRRAKIDCLYRLADLYNLMQHSEQALAFADQAIALAAGDAEPDLMTVAYEQKGNALVRLNKFEATIDAYEMALKLAKRAQAPGNEARLLSNLADVYLRTKNFRMAERRAREALRQAEHSKFKPAAMYARANLGFALAGQGQLNQAMPLLNAALAHFKATNRKNTTEEMLGEMSRMFESAKMYKEALAHAREQQSLTADLYSSDRAKSVATLQEQFDADQRKRKIEALARENLIQEVELKNRRLEQITQLLATIIAVLAGGVIYFLYRRVRKANLTLAEVNQKLEYSVVHDPLTGLLNRRSFLNLMQSREHRVDTGRRKSEAVDTDCLMLLDIDMFKAINDTYGHSVGDAVLIELARRIRLAMREADMCMRWGGEEFMVFSPNTSAQQLVPLVRRVLHSVGSEPIEAGGHAIGVTISIGFISLPFSDLPESVFDWEKAMQLADMALYLSKVNGRNQAYGLLRLLGPYEDCLPQMEKNLSSAINDGLVDMVMVSGPPLA